MNDKEICVVISSDGRPYYFEDVNHWCYENLDPREWAQYYGSTKGDPRTKRAYYFYSVSAATLFILRWK